MKHILLVTATAIIVAVSSASGSTAPPLQPRPITVREIQTLDAPQLAKELIGERLASRVVEVTRHQYGGLDGVPSSVDLFTRPQLAYPRINRICQTDVITIEFNWFDHDQVDAATPLTIRHIEASSRFKAFPMPPGEPGTPENEQAQEAACAQFSTALDAFRAPNAGDAQWLVSIEEEYTQTPRNERFSFECDDFEDRTCKRAFVALPRLALNLATEVKEQDCPKVSKRRWYKTCFQLSFPYVGKTDPEWVMSVEAFIRDGSAPVEIERLTLKHEQKPFAVP